MRIALTLLAVVVALAGGAQHVGTLDAVAEVAIARAWSSGDVDAPNSRLADDRADVVPLRSLGSFYVCDVAVDGVTGTYIIDSGSPGLILNRAPGGTTERGLGLNGALAYTRVDVDELSWGPVVQRDVRAVGVDLSHLSDAFGEPIAGLIGHDQLAAAAFTLDLSAGHVRFWRDAPRTLPGAVTLKLRMVDHLPALRSRLGGARAVLALDTGSGVNLLDERRRRRLPAAAHVPIDDIRLRDLSARYTRVPRSRVHLTEVDKGNWVGLPFAFVDLGAFDRDGIDIDGVLGKEWMRRHTVTFDYARRRVHVQ